MSDPSSFHPPPPPSAPPPPPPGGGEPVAGNPWEHRERLGFFNALVEAVKLFATAPGEAFARTRRQGDFGSPILFAVLIGWLATLIGQIWGVMFNSSFLMFMPPEMRENMGAMLAGSTAGVVFSIILAPIFIVIGLFIGAAILHLCLMIVGGLNQSQAGFEGTVRAISYSSVAQLAQIVPFVGGIVAFVWAIVLYVIGLSTLHNTTQGKALAAVLIPVLLCCLCILVALVTVGGAIMAAFSGAMHGS